ncbi:hypothetical protein K6H11_005276 [Candida tropicalis]
MQDLIDKIQTSENLLESLNKLGDELRQDSNRISIYDQLPILVPNFSKFLLQSSIKLQLETLRVLINISANNDQNRNYLTDDSDHHVIGLWSVIKNHLDIMNDVTKFVFIFLNQFIYNTQNKEKYIRFLYGQNIQVKLYPIITDETWNEIGEFIYELLSLTNDKSIKDEEFIKSCIDIDISIDNEDEDEDEESESIWVDLLTLNKPSNILYQRVLEIIPKKQSSLIKRKLFSLACDLAVDDESLKVALDNINKTTDPYVFSTYCITIGNSIHDKASFEETRGLVELNLGIVKLQELYFIKNKITDVVQIQSIHMWNNLLDEKSTKEILTEYMNQLIAISKIIIDNGNYYKEILILYYKFIKKLIRLSETPPADLIQFILDNDQGQSVLEIKYLLLQSYPEAYLELIGEIVQNVNTTNVLEQLKTLGIINKSLESGRLKLEDSHDKYVKPLGQVLSQLSNELDNQKGNNTSWEFRAFENNLKYVAGTTINLLKETDTDILNTCNHILE